MGKKWAWASVNMGSVNVGMGQCEHGQCEHGHGALTDPSWAARCEHGHGLVVVGVALQVISQAVQQLHALLHDRQVGTQQRICGADASAWDDRALQAAGGLRKVLMGGRGLRAAGGLRGV
eukprot:365244-Chlamydomonas_euryale.AAC.10